MADDPKKPADQNADKTQSPAAAPRIDPNPTGTAQQAAASAGRTSPAGSEAPVSPGPQNLNASPSPLGDGIQSSDAERRAAGLDTAVNQPAQQRVNAAIRRELGADANQPERAGERASLIQTPGEVPPADIVGDALAAAEGRRTAMQEEAQAALSRDLPQATLDEIEAGRAALRRNRPNTAQQQAEQPAPVRA